jgi:hypothetical protein
LTALAVINSATNIAFTLAASIVIVRLSESSGLFESIGAGSREPSPLFFFAPSLAGCDRIESGAGPGGAAEIANADDGRIGKWKVNHATNCR